jgi:hypothetical protein
LGRFAAGNPGRPFGTRNRVSARVARAILHNFEENQVELLARMSRWYLPQYLQVVSRLLPRGGEAGAAEDGLGDGGERQEVLSQAEAAAMIGDMRALLDRIEAGAASPEGAGTDIIGR